MSDRVTIDINDHVAEVTLSRPEKYNALDPAMFEAITEAGRSLATNKSVRAVVLCGAGENFCAGIDLASFADGANPGSAERMQAEQGTPANYFQSPCYVWSALPVPVIAALRGVVFGGGLQIAAGADIRYAHPQAKLSVMEIKWGIIPDMALSWTLRDVVAVDKLKELTYSGRVVSGTEAAEIGLVTRVVDEPLDAARRLAAEIAKKSPDAIRGAKALFDQAWATSRERGLRLEAEIQMGLLTGSNQREAVMANMEKREPRFKDPE